MDVDIKRVTHKCVCVWMSKQNRIIEWKEKDNTGEKSGNIVVGAFYNYWYNLQWVGNKLIFFTCHPSLSYQVSNLIGPVLRTTRWTDRCSYLKSNRIFLLLFHLHCRPLLCNNELSRICNLIHKESTMVDYNKEEKERRE